MPPEMSAVLQLRNLAMYHRVHPATGHATTATRHPRRRRGMNLAAYPQQHECW